MPAPRNLSLKFSKQPPPFTSSLLSVEPLSQWMPLRIMFPILCSFHICIVQSFKISRWGGVIYVYDRFWSTITFVIPILTGCNNGTNRLRDTLSARVGFSNCGRSMKLEVKQHTRDFAPNQTQFLPIPFPPSFFCFIPILRKLQQVLFKQEPWLMIGAIGAWQLLAIICNYWQLYAARLLVVGAKKRWSYFRGAFT